MTGEASDQLAVLRARIARIELDWRARFLPPPTRDAPTPDPEAVRVARVLERCGGILDRIGGRLRGPAADGGATGDALLQHLGFLVALTESGPVADPDALLGSVEHLEQVSRQPVLRPG